MAQRIVTLLEDDISGGEAVETIAFGLDGAAYEIDLNAKNAAQLRKALTVYVENARRVSSGPGVRRRSAATRGSKQASASASPSAAEIRNWAASNGMEVPARGRIPASVREAFDAR